MTVNVGINPFGGRLSYCDGSGESIIDCSITQVEPGDNKEKIDLMFEEIKSKIKGNIGCICICLYSNYDNEVRKNFIESGLNNGFKNVEIINYETAIYLNALSQTKYIPFNGNVIWIEWIRDFYVWVINDQTSKLVGRWTANSSKLNELQKVVEKSKLKKSPDIVLHYKEIVEANFKEISACRFYRYKYDTFGDSRASLLKARKTPDNCNLAHLRTQNFLSKKITFKMGDELISSYKYFQELPIKSFEKVKRNFIDDMLTVRNEDNKIKANIQIPDLRTLKVEFQIDSNEIYSVKCIPPTVITITNNNVLIYHDKIKNPFKFPASIDYGFDLPKVGVYYESPTVISDIIKYFGISKNSATSREIYSSTGLKRYYVLKIGALKRFVENEMTVVDLFKEAINQSALSKEYLVLTVPLNFSESQKEAYLKAAETAGFSDVTTVDEQVALAFGYEHQCNVVPDIEYVLINFCDTLIKITLNKAKDFDKENCLQKTIQCENMVLSKSAFFDNILHDAENELSNEKTDLELLLQNFVFAVNELIEASTNMNTIVITSNKLCELIIQDICPASINIVFIENPEEIIVKGAAWA